MVYITGDLHGDFSRFSSPCYASPAQRGHPDRLRGFRLYMERGQEGRGLAKKIGSRPYAVLFLDGCHENFDLLKEYPVTDWKGGRAQVISGNLVHLMRGQLYTLEGYRFFTFGGGESREYDLRDGAKTWWEEEMPSAGEMTQGLETLAAAGNQGGFILTHEPLRPCQGNIWPAGTTGWTASTSTSTGWRRSPPTSDGSSGSLHMDKTMSKQHVAVFQTVVPVVESHAKRK